eukprot:TRINITY_DN62902_c0_g1_i2.p1 TRINITY_DN62902_c0_g1~~TRINITY_DN62902_c0_g1_i2.p1  ORF type:complete len:266 (-),score=42.52 TRINITY_DN62902_c0_g1_i2:260-1018(-)
MVVTQAGNWLKLNGGFFTESPDGNPVMWQTTITSKSGETAANVWVGHTGVNITGGGDYGISSQTFDEHQSAYQLLNGGCLYHYLYSYSGIVYDGDAGYDARVALGTGWPATHGCHGSEGGTTALRWQLKHDVSGASSLAEGEAVADQNEAVHRTNPVHSQTQLTRNNFLKDSHNKAPTGSIVVGVVLVVGVVGVAVVAVVLGVVFKARFAMKTQAPQPAPTTEARPSTEIMLHKSAATPPSENEAAAEMDTV